MVKCTRILSVMFAIKGLGATATIRYDVSKDGAPTYDAAVCIGPQPEKLGGSCHGSNPDSPGERKCRGKALVCPSLGLLLSDMIIGDCYSCDGGRTWYPARVTLEWWRRPECPTGPDSCQYDE
jgi:hypothetical protein